MRTFTDALQCAEDIAEREAAKTHYKDYVGQLIKSMKSDSLIVDKYGDVVSSTNLRSLDVYKLMNFTSEVANRYGLSSEAIKDTKDLDGRLDRAVKGLETEIGLKQAHCSRLLEQIKKKEQSANHL